ncbi:alanine racemase [Candidatus Nesciobacter abundans]|uniref:alanine racemase n=1 Tax=Candidatus Nesciobacter abundans TaxID=2601668 RepID=A0A5C0UGZ5_9PROT|nr:alanine racemase [Candidatus Nesciobacter abundans]QEK39000.1 alanine racemase [Candidatus Nesciobacter abundans]
MYNKPFLKINLSNLVKNYLNLSKDIKCAAVIKCNAYGLGAKEIYEHLRKNTNCKDFFVNSVEEADEILSTALSGHNNIYILSGYTKYQLDHVFDKGFIPVCFSVEQIRDWNDHCEKVKKNKPIVVQLETGMNRLGISLQELENVTDITRVKFFMQHLSHGYDLESDQNQSQIEKTNHFKELINEKFNQLANETKFSTNTLFSLSSSCGLLLGREFHGNMIRLGRFLYGFNEDCADLKLENVAELFAKVIKINHVKKDCGVGYDHKHITEKDSKVGILNIGYGDGYIVGNSYGFLNGKYCKILSVSMDYTMIDLTDLDLKDKDLLFANIELLGKNITAEKLKHWNNKKAQGTEILTTIGRRVDRIYLK